MKSEARDRLRVKDEGTRAQLAARMAEAEAKGERVRAAELSLELAVFERAAGNDAAAGPLLMKSVVLAHETGEAGLHAKGRLELGDLAQAQGDLITACEHWQMARTLADGVGRGGEKAEAEARMKANGCPTDWVLNDF